MGGAQECALECTQSISRTSVEGVGQAPPGFTLSSEPLLLKGSLSPLGFICALAV